MWPITETLHVYLKTYMECTGVYSLCIMSINTSTCGNSTIFVSMVEMNNSGQV